MNIRVEKHIIKYNHKYYKLLDDFCFKSKNLYNFANYQIRQSFIKNGKYINFNALDKLLKQKEMDFDYRQMPMASIAQQTLRYLDNNWKTFFTSMEDWKKHKEKYSGRPKIPKYLKKNGRYTVILTNQNCKIKDGIIRFPKSFKGFTLKTKVDQLQQIRVIPRNQYIVIEVVYKINIPDKIQENGRYYSVDVGLDNLLTVTNNFGETAFAVNGKGLKSANQYYNKKLSHYREIAKRMNQLDWTNRMQKLTNKRNNIIQDFIHKASKFIVDSALESNVSVIVIGNNKKWKYKSKLSKKTNQSFVGIPHGELINKIVYKAENVGIKVIITEESYTSGTSFIDGEYPIKENYNKSRRKHRGLFVSNNGIKINADVNGSYQIMKKVFPNAFANGIEGVGLHPFIVNIH